MPVNAPSRREPPAAWEHRPLWTRVREITSRLEGHFKSTITVGGINATEIYSFGEVLGLIIESEIVKSLNDLRDEWDPYGKYKKYAFVRQPQTFPDVLFTDATSKDTLFGIELKSWYSHGNK